MRSILIIAGVTALAFALPTAAPPSDKSIQSGQRQGAMDTEGLQPGTYLEGQGTIDTEGLQPGTYSEDQGPLGEKTDSDQDVDKASPDSSKEQPPRTEFVEGIRGALDEASPNSQKGQPPSTESVQGIRGSLDKGSPNSQKDQLPAIQQDGPQRQQ